MDVDCRRPRHDENYSSLFVENSHPETLHRDMCIACSGSSSGLRLPPLRTMPIHKIVSIKRCQSYFISRRSPHLGISKDSELCTSAHRCLHYAYARLIARVTFHSSNKKGILADASDCRQNAFGQHSRSVFLVLGSKSVYLINNKHFWVPLFPFLAIIFASFFRFMQANVSPTFISIRAFPIICV